MPSHRHMTRRSLFASLLALTLTACGSTGESPRPTTPSGASTASIPTAVAANTTIPAPPATATRSAATAVAPSATAAPQSQPVIAFDPKSGGPGTTVTMSGWGFAPNTHIIVNFGLPQPSDMPLADALSDAQGRWSASFGLPSKRHSGEPITTRDTVLIAMSDQGKPLASAPFAFQPAQPPTTQPEQPTTQPEQPTTQPEQPTPHGDGGPQDGAWETVFSADINRDGIAEQLAYKANGSLFDKVASLPVSSDTRLVASELTITQPGVEGPGRTLLALNRNQINAHDKQLGSFGTTVQPAGFLIGVTSGSDASFEIVPLNADGSEYTQRIGIAWDASAGAYRITNATHQ